MDLVNNFYLPDLLAIGHIYAQKGLITGGAGLAKERVLGILAPSRRTICRYS